MANSKVIITFLEIPTANDILHISETLLGLDILEKFRPIRTGLKQTKIPTSTTIIDDLGDPVTVFTSTISQNYRDAFNLDYNATGLFTISFVGNTATGLGVVTIEANYPGAVFADTNTLDYVEFDIINEDPVVPINITDVAYSQAAALTCQKVAVSVTTDILAAKILSPVSVDPNTDNPFTFEGLRGQTLSVVVEDSLGNQNTQAITLPSILSASNFSLNISNSPNGATVTVNNTNSSGLVLQYSLDNLTWQTSNVFSGLDTDTYTLYVKDQLGCFCTIDFSVTSTNIYVPFFYISKSNSIRYAQRIDWGDAANYKNDENTLSCEVNVLLPHKQILLFQTSDVITTQFKSNYKFNNANVLRADNSVVSVPVNKMTNNIGRTDMRDARMYNLTNGKTGIYFLAGNTYDYTTLMPNGTHALNGILPEWGIVGNYINISGTWFIIEDTLFDESKNADVLVINQIYTSAEVNIIAGSIYNLFDYEVYEFSIDMVDYINESIRVNIICTDPNFQTITYLSEEISVKVRHENTVDIHYWNDTNNDVYYTTGIKHRIRVPFTKLEGQADEESNINKTDANTTLLSAEMYEGDKFIFEPQTKEVWRKMMMALSHKFVFMDDVQYVKNGDFETEGPLEQTNLYVLKASMLKSGTVYNSDGSTFPLGNSGQAQIPGIIQGDNGFIAY